MKAPVLTTALLLLIAVPLFAQDQQFGGERRVGIELERRAHFYAVDERYQPYEDTLFYANAGFLIHAEYDVVQELDGTVYVYLTYPDFVETGTQVATDGPGYGYDQPLEPYVAAQPLPDADAAPVYYDTLLPPPPPPPVPVVSPSYYEVPVQQSARALRYPLHGLNGRILRMPKAVFDDLPKTEIYDTNWKRGRNYRLTSGFLSIPFKLRPSLDTSNFALATDATIGPYLGITKRLARRREFYATVPLTLGLSYLNVNDNNTDTSVRRSDVNVLPGVSWSTGLIFQLNQFNIGFVLGKDYVSDIGDAWQYHGKTWYAFALGYSFLGTDK